MNSMNVVVGAVGLSKYTGAISPVYYALYPLSDNADIHFYDAVFSNHTFQRYLLIYGKGILIKEGDSGKLNTIRMKISSADLKTIPLPFPTPEEQSAIARFLNSKNVQIKRFIRNRRRLIEVLNEQKQAIINRAVTRGLDPDVPLKPTGIDWLGNIPEHWKCVKVKQCAKTISKGTTPSTEGKEILLSGPIRFIKAENIVEGRITDAPAFFIDEDTNRSLKRSILFENDILFVIAGATIGKTAIVQSCNLPANTNQAVAFIRPNKSVNPRFLELWLQTSFVKEMIWLDAVQTAQPNLSMGDLGNFAIPMTTTDEQQAIVKRTELDTREIDNTIRIAQREINLILEYRTRLISDVVTGKIDVRHLAPPRGNEDMEDMAEALEPLEDVIDDVEMDEEGGGQ